MRYGAAFFIILLAGCSTISEQKERATPARPISVIVTDTVRGTAEGAWVAVQTPFEDMNLRQQPIPEKLQKISDNPYAHSRQMLCEDIRQEIYELDSLLGPDVCTPGNPTDTVISRKGEYVEQGAGFVRDQAVGMVSSKVNIIPFRGVVRKITGAERHAKEVERAYQAGKLRRAFLKGIASSLWSDCLDPKNNGAP